MRKTASKQCGKAIKMNVRNGKKFLSLLLAVCLLVGCWPVSALGSEARKSNTETQLSADRELTEAECEEIAKAYWDRPSGEGVHGGNSMTFHGKKYYNYILKWWVEDHWSAVDYLFVEAATGNCYYGFSEPEYRVIKVKGNETLSFEGILTQRDYEINSANKGTAYILKLDEDIRVKIFDSTQGYYGGAKKLNEIQVNFSTAVSKGDIQKGLNCRIEVKGSAIIAHTGHHLTPVVLTEGQIVSNTSSNGSDTDIKAIWKEFIVSKKYLEHTKHWRKNPEGYAILDIDGDGKEELIIRSAMDDLGFANFIVFEYDISTGIINNVKYENDNNEFIYGQYCRAFRYSQKYHAIVYQPLNNGMQYADWGYLSLQKGKFSLLQRLKFDLYTIDLPAPYCLVRNGITQTLTEAQYNSYLEETKFVEFSNIGEIVKTKSDIAVFTTEKSLTVKTGRSMWLSFGKITDGEMVGDWKRMAVVVSDPTVLSLSEYEKTEYGYVLKATGRKPGATNVTITDTESGLNTVIVVTVRDSYVGTYSYAIDNMETFYPNNKWENSIQTNIYDLNGLYVNHYQCSKSGNTYKVSFDAYNSKYHTGAVDIYDANGNWIDCKEIKKYSMISSLWDTRDQYYELVWDVIERKLLTYEQNSFSKMSHISFEVPDGGYFTISNNFAESPGTFLFNSCDILYDGVCTLIDAGLDEIKPSAFSGLIKEKIVKNESVRKKFVEIFKKTVEKEARAYAKRILSKEIGGTCSDISGQFENLLSSLDISWKHLFKTAAGVGESAFTKFSGPAGIALKGCFAFSKGSNQLLQAVHLAASVDEAYATVFSSIDEGYINSHGVVVNTNGNVDAEAELHVFRVSNDNTIEIVLNGSGDNHLQKYELYNICFVKNDQLVQPNGRVKVRIPIPDGMKKDTCCVYRQEANGNWTILNARIEGNYLAFETDHFSLYGVAGSLNELVISSLPNKTSYNAGEILDVEGLVLVLNGDLITNGFICDPMVLSEGGTQKVTVRYGAASAEFEIFVEDNIIPDVPEDWENPYTDVSKSDWYYDAVGYVTVRSLMNGHGNGKFGPNEKISRGQFAQIIYNKEGRPKAAESGGFSDVPKGQWFYDAVTWAAGSGVVSGYGNGKYGPNDPITREQLAVMLWRYAGKPESSGNLEGFADRERAEDYAVQALQWAVEKGIMSGKGNGILDPGGRATRGEAAQMVKQFCKALDEEKAEET